MVQNPLVRYAREAWWTYLPRQEAFRPRHGEEGAVLYDVLVEPLRRLKPEVVDDTRPEHLPRRLVPVPPMVHLSKAEAWAPTHQLDVTVRAI